jgi:hypothetical protein
MSGKLGTAGIQIGAGAGTGKWSNSGTMSINTAHTTFTIPAIDTKAAVTAIVVNSGTLNISDSNNKGIGILLYKTANTFTNTGTININRNVRATNTEAIIDNQGVINFNLASENVSITHSKIKIQNNGGKLNGIGRVAAGTTIDNTATGTIAPGIGTNSIGTIKFMGTVATLTGNVEMDVNGTTAGTYDQVIMPDATSTLTVTGATLKMTAGYSPALMDKVSLFEATTAVTSPFTSVELPTNWSMDYTDPLKVQVVKDGTTGLKKPSSKYEVYASENAIVVLNGIGKKITVFNPTGRMIKNVVATSNKEIIPSGRGFFMVSVGTQVLKVIVK